MSFLPASLSCDRCSARGWVQDRGVWPDPCPSCLGLGTFTFRTLGKRIDEKPETLERLYKLRVRSKTARRILRKLMEMMNA